MTAKLIEDNLEGFNGRAGFYQLNPPIEDYEGNKHEFVIVSAVNAMFSGPETYIFPANENKTVKSFGELDGSYRGGYSHAQALNGAGYEIVS